MPQSSEKMSSRDRVLQAISHKQPDRIPIDYWAVSEVSERLIQHFGVADQEALLRHLNVDLRYFRGPGLDGPELHKLGDGRIVDHWGVVRQKKTVEGSDKDGHPWKWTYRHLETSPLAAMESVREIEAYSGWPNAEMWDYSGVKAEAQRIRDAGLAVVFGGDRLDRSAQLKPATYIRGTEQFLIDMVEEPEIAECVVEHLVAYYLDYNRRVFEAADGLIDIFFMGDDMGTQNGLWVSPNQYRRFFKENFRRFNDLAHKYGAKTMYHSCGAVTALIPEFIECGLDILQSLQPAALDPVAIKREYGRDLVFQGGMDIQDTLPKGSPDDVRKEVQLRAESLGPGGGYIFGTAHNLLPDVPTENIEALFDAYLEYGVYR